MVRENVYVGPSFSDEKIRESFGDDVAFLVDGVTKVDNIIFKSEEHKQAENFIKLFI